MWIDLHGHTGGISKCCKISAEDNIALAKKEGFKGMAITNHYVSTYFDSESYAAWIEDYISEWNKCKRLGEKQGLQIFCGVEVTMDWDPRVHMLIYGADEDFLRNNPLLCERSLQELYEICKSNGCALVQAHPFRGDVGILNTDFLDGIEVNCHPIYKNSFTNEIFSAANKAGIAVTVGCDYHADTYRPIAGMILPDSIVTDRDLADFIKTANVFEVLIHDISSDEVYTTEYVRDWSKVNEEDF